ncbi:MAG: DUF2281 domain-containing protein [Candidatus Wallbacteria bacterium]|nr:DUF2281 domain-containing protein [Candidatus Wallbacteria bacterium]
MSKKELLISEIEHFPDPFLDEILDFIGYLKQKLAGDKIETDEASEAVLRQDWLKAEEDEAWQDL